MYVAKYCCIEIDNSMEIVVYQLVLKSVQVGLGASKVQGSLGSSDM